MRRIVIDAALVALATIVILAVHGEAQQDPSRVLFGYRFGLEATDGAINNANASTGSRGTVDISWRTTPGINSSFNGNFSASCTAVAIPESGPVPDGAFPDS